jgi:hypothetical protein
VIPKENGKEANCYEFRCKSSETKEEVLIYINADKGYEEDNFICSVFQKVVLKQNDGR